eukprot:Amastigsp_a344065_5.p4 type:complete len:119 gc:universal Amastigsp_a344065_5:639-283(-)
MLWAAHSNARDRQRARCEHVSELLAPTARSRGAHHLFARPDDAACPRQDRQRHACVSSATRVLRVELQRERARCDPQRGLRWPEALRGGRRRGGQGRVLRVLLGARMLLHQVRRVRLL